ncbi:hypothetical protein pb186bvf_001906 [Paramecium bursaria]
MIQQIENEGKQMTFEFDDEQFQPLHQNPNSIQQFEKNKIKGKIAYPPNSINQNKSQTSIKELYLLWNYVRGQNQQEKITSKQLSENAQKTTIIQQQEKQQNSKILIPQLQKSQSQIYQRRKSISNQWIINQNFINKQENTLTNSKILNTSPDKQQNFRQFLLNKKNTQLIKDDSADKQLTPSPLVLTESTMCQQRKRAQSQESFETMMKSSQIKQNHQNDKEAKSSRGNLRRTIIYSGMRKSNSQELSPIQLRQKSSKKLRQYKQNKYIHHLGLLLSNNCLTTGRTLVQGQIDNNETKMEGSIKKARILKEIDLN